MKVSDLLIFSRRPNMKGHRMIWEWNWPVFWGWKHYISVFSFSVDYNKRGDHAPGLHVCLILFNLKLLDFGYYNVYHEGDPEGRPYTWIELEGTVSLLETLDEPFEDTDRVRIGISMPAEHFNSQAHKIPIGAEAAISIKHYLDTNVK